MRERTYKDREAMPRLCYSLREVADMLGYKSTSALYACVYLPKDHPHHIPTITIPIHRGKLRIPAWWIQEQLEQQTGTCGALPKSATPTHAGGRPRGHLTASEVEQVATAGGDTDSNYGCGGGDSDTRDNTTAVKHTHSRPDDDCGDEPQESGPRRRVWVFGDDPKDNSSRANAAQSVQLRSASTDDTDGDVQ